MTLTQRKILFTVTLTQAFAVGMSFGLLPILLQPLENSFSVSRTQVSAGQIVMMVAMSFGGIAVGIALDKGHPRRIMLGGATLLIAGLALGSMVQQFWVLGLVAFTLGLSLPAVGPLIGAGLVTRYFGADRGRALGVMSIGPPLGSGAFAALAGIMLPDYGWQQVFAVFAVLALLVMLPLILWAIPKQFPQTQTANQAVGAGFTADDSTAKESAVNESTMLDVLRTPVFFWTLLAYALTMGTSTAWTVHIAAFLATLGMTAGQQSLVLALIFWMGIPGSLLLGYLADKFKPAVLFLLVMAVQGLSYLAFAASLPVPMIVFLGAIAGFLTGGAIPLYTMLLGQRLSANNFGKAMGVSNLFLLPVMAGAVLLAAGLYERYGNYTIALLILALLPFLALLCLLRSNALAKQQPV